MRLVVRCRGDYETGCVVQEGLCGAGGTMRLGVWCRGDY